MSGSQTKAPGFAGGYLLHVVTHLLAGWALAETAKLKPLTGWQNTTITVALLLFAIGLAVKRGYSPVGLFSARADAAFVGALQRRFGSH